MNNNEISYKGITVERLLDYLSDKTLSFGCILYCESEDEFWNITDENKSEFNKKDDKLIMPYNGLIWEIIGHPVMIGDVLKKLPFKRTNHLRATDIYILWEPCDLSLPLNEILSGKTYERRMRGTEVEVFMDDNVQALFEFLVDTFKDSIESAFMTN